MMHNQALLFRNNGELLFVEILHFKKRYCFFYLLNLTKFCFIFSQEKKNCQCSKLFLDFQIQGKNVN